MQPRPRPRPGPGFGFIIFIMTLKLCESLVVADNDDPPKLCQCLCLCIENICTQLRFLSQLEFAILLAIFAICIVGAVSRGQPGQRGTGNCSRNYINYKVPALRRLTDLTLLLLCLFRHDLLT